MIIIKKTLLTIMLFLIAFSSISILSASKTSVAAADDTITLRVSNWEEYIDLGDWDSDETIDLDSGDIIGKNSMIEDFENWYYETYNQKVKVEYSTFGTNEDLYNQLSLGDTFDIVCPSEYMIMKLLSENRLVPLSKEFFDTSNDNNYYINGVSPYIRNIFETSDIDGKYWGDYAAGYMWGNIGVVYNPEKVTEKDASTWSILINDKYKRQVTVKDSVRETYFPTMAILNKDLFLSEKFKSQPDYQKNLLNTINDTSDKTVTKAQDLLKQIRENAYSFETDSGKADMVTGKVLANLQWSGDAVYTLDQAEEDGYYLNYSVPEECSNVWFDGWVMLKDGINNDSRKQHAAEAFMNFLSRGDNVVRNMYYIGYTSVISNDKENRVFDYANWCYGSDSKDAVSYPVGFFFCGDNKSTKYVLKVDKEQTKRQLFAQYPPEEVLNRCVIMNYFDDKANEKVNQMWINVRCFSFSSIPIYGYILGGVIVILIILTVILIIKKDNIFRKK